MFASCRIAIRFQRAFARRVFVWISRVLAGLMVCCNPVAATEARNSEKVEEFLAANCFDCHSGDDAEAGLNLEDEASNWSDRSALRRWIRIHDRVRNGEMPPKDFGKVDPKNAMRFLEDVSNNIRRVEQEDRSIYGRVKGRRLTRRQVERSLHDLLGIDIPLADRLPEESQVHRYSTFAESQAMSHFQMQSHLAVVDLALDEAFRRALTFEDTLEREFDARGLARTNPRRRCREPEMRNGQAVIWNGGVTFYGRIPATTAPEDGWYKFALQVSAIKPPPNAGVWSMIRTGLCVSSAPLLTHVVSFEATADPKTVEFETWLPKGHMLEIRPGDVTLKRGRFAGGQIGTGEGEPQDIPGIAFDWLTMKRIHRRSTDDGVRRRLFGDLAVRLDDDGATIDTKSSFTDADRLVRDFARRVFRKPVDEETLRPYIGSVNFALAEGMEFHEALRVAYRAILCSPRFLYLTESPGQLTAHEIATRLSYFITGSTPDEELSTLADGGALLNKGVLRAEVERLLSSPDGSRFVRDFAGEWLDLDKMNESAVDRKKYRQFDAIVERSMLDETHAFLQALLTENQSVVRLIDANFTFLNSRLARYYDVDDVLGDELQRVRLPLQSHRAGLLTQGTVLKVTANGSDTSPVVRGVWVSERLLGLPIPPPPENVPAIEPDVRGARTIREQLAKHRADQSCASCHAKIDPAGFALENFDPAGKWRDVYTLKGRKRSPIRIDASYELPDGRAFEGIDEFRNLVAAEPRKLARNVVEQLLVYGTGAPISFSDRQVVETIVDEVGEEDFGLRSIVHAAVSSPIFLNK